MINLIVGVKGTGKTKRLIDDVNKAVCASHGVVVCIEYGKKLTYDINYQVRLIDAKDYNIKDGQSLYGFVCGILAGNYDVSELFIDSALKICQDNMPSFEKFVGDLESIVDRYSLHCVITASMPAEKLPDSLGKYVGNE